jgi:hypothetical protein
VVAEQKRMAEKGLDKKDLEQIFTGFEKRQDEKYRHSKSEL